MTSSISSLRPSRSRESNRTMAASMAPDASQGTRARRAARVKSSTSNAVRAAAIMSDGSPPPPSNRQTATRSACSGVSAPVRSEASASSP
jgi:hypothetical protein